MATGCDTFVALGNSTITKSTIFAKNSDRPKDECQTLIEVPRLNHETNSIVKCQFIEIPQSETTYRHFGSQPYWLWGYEHGFNEHQVVIGNEAVHSKFPDNISPGLLGMDLVRLGLERGNSASSAVNIITNLISKYGQGKFTKNHKSSNYDNSFIVADPNEAYIVEAANKEWVTKKIDSTIGISNIYSINTDWTNISSTAKQTSIENKWYIESQERLDFFKTFSNDEIKGVKEGRGEFRRIRSCTYLNLFKGKLDLNIFLSLLKDHSNGENPSENIQLNYSNNRSICMHYGENSISNTAASLIADLSQDKNRTAIYWCSLYTPCIGIFIPIFCEGNLPEKLSLKSKEFSKETLWWKFHSINKKINEDNNTKSSKTEFVRSSFLPLQKTFIKDSYIIAKEAQTLINSGQKIKANNLLSEYMNNSFKKVYNLTEEINKLI